MPAVVGSDCTAPWDVIAEAIQISVQVVLASGGKAANRACVCVFGGWCTRTDRHGVERALARPSRWRFVATTVVPHAVRFL